MNFGALRPAAFEARQGLLQQDLAVDDRLQRLLHDLLSILRRGAAANC